MPSGGYREGSGRAKTGYYKGIYCGSTYELCWVIYNLDNNIKFSRFPNKLEKDGVSYFPDFLLSDEKTIIEIKGYEKEEFVDKKTKVANSLGFDVIVLRKKDLLHVFEYVYKKYKTKKFYELYDNYKPQYTYSCGFCNKFILTEKKRKTSLKFCDRICSGKYRKTKITPELNKKISETLTGKSPVKYNRKYKQIWITNGIINTRIREDSSIPEGFYKGRVPKLVR